ncbi:ABC transporter ATP-binding protein [Pelagovum pacificum]|uniref:ABC transporter ATP-binding protein n=1 Tax=Pelagovum pacificum TaxID=2588711 RepID=A0A5C5GCS4_9RHOB|nr:ABC transporter ATP-binding protein [Pelagovum pacificum]QQA41416.1 ABC transporter ATP-binding protein [Pelagovum pacificum]TNY31781.1 ABC transporter ATP-binding protein [Pelagovum pacificum]
MSSLELENINKSYGGFQVLKDINLSVEEGEFIVMVGPSGCGKSTLLKCIAGLEPIEEGAMRIKGGDVTKMEPGDRDIAMVFQSYALYPHMTVAENMGFGLRMAKRPKAEIKDGVDRAARILRLEDQLDKRPAQLSGGQRQRVAIGRAITRSPAVFLFDEPLSNLDAALRTQMRVELSTLHAQLGATMIYVTHDQTEAMTMSDRIVVLNGGRIEQVGTPEELYVNPRNQFVASFLGAPRMNFFEGTVAGSGAGVLTVELPGLGRIDVPSVDNAPVHTGDTISVGIRPEHMRIARGDGPRVSAKVRLVEYLGKETIVYADATPLACTSSETGTDNVTVHLPEVRHLTADDTIEISIDPADVYLFGGEDDATLTASK